MLDPSTFFVCSTPQNQKINDSSLKLDYKPKINPFPAVVKCNGAISIQKLRQNISYRKQKKTCKSPKWGYCIGLYTKQATFIVPCYRLKPSPLGGTALAFLSLALTVAKGVGRKSISYTAARRDRLDPNSSGDFQSLFKPSGFSRWWFSLRFCGRWCEAISMQTN